MKHAQASCPETVFQILPGTLPECLRKLTTAAVSPDFIFADPPYAESAGLLDGILRNGDFSEWVGEALLLWELPDYRSPLKVFPGNWKLKTIRELGASRFLMIERRKNGE